MRRQVNSNLKADKQSSETSNSVNVNNGIVNIISQMQNNNQSEGTKLSKENKNLWTKTKENIHFAIIILTFLGSGGIFWFNKPMIYKGSVLDSNIRNNIVGAEITFIGLTNEIQVCQTDNNGFFYIQLPKEYQNVKIKIIHKDYERWIQLLSATKISTKIDKKFQLEI